MGTAFTVIEDGRTAELEAQVEGGDVRLSADALRDGLGWELKDEGLCRGALCVPVRDRSALQVEGRIDLRAFADAVGQPLALDVDEACAALGTPVADRTRLLETLEAPDFTLPDLDGKPHSLSDHRGKKVLLIAYASW